MMKFKAIIFLIGLCLSGFGYAQTYPNYSDEEKQTALKLMVAQVQAKNEAQRSRINAEKEIVRKSTSGLNKQKQIAELNDTILYMYGNEPLINYIQSKIVNIPTKPKNIDKVNCLANTYNYENFKNYINQQTSEYGQNHTEQRLQKDLQLLIDSGLSYEIHERFFESLKAKNEEDKLTSLNLFKLHLLQQPKLQSAFNNLVNNPDYLELKSLTGFNANPNKLLIVQFLDERLKQCDIKTGDLFLKL